jgi:hypothetical protein
MHVAIVWDISEWTDVSDEPITCMFRVEYQPSQKKRAAVD